MHKKIHLKNYYNCKSVNYDVSVVFDWHIIVVS